MLHKIWQSSQVKAKFLRVPLWLLGSRLQHKMHEWCWMLDSWVATFTATTHFAMCGQASLSDWHRTHKVPIPALLSNTQPRPSASFRYRVPSEPSKVSETLKTSPAMRRSFVLARCGIFQIWQSFPDDSIPNLTNLAFKVHVWSGLFGQFMTIPAWCHIWQALIECQHDIHRLAHSARPRALLLWLPHLQRWCCPNPSESPIVYLHIWAWSTSTSSIQ